MERERKRERERERERLRLRRWAYKKCLGRKTNLKEKLRCGVFIR